MSNKFYMSTARLLVRRLGLYMTSSDARLHYPRVHQLFLEMRQELHDDMRFRFRSVTSFQQRHYDVYQDHPELHNSIEYMYMRSVAIILDSRPVIDDSQIVCDDQRP